MSDVSTIPATKVASSGSSHGTGNGASAKIAAGGNFWDLILTKLTSGGEDDLSSLLQSPAQTVPATTTSTTTANAGKAPQNPLAMLQLALSNQTVDENGNIILPKSQDEVKDLKTQLELTNKIINHLKNALPENGDRNNIMGQVLAKLQTRSDTLQASISTLESGTISKDTPLEDIPAPTLISLGLNPAEIAQVSDTIKQMQEKLGRDVTIDDLMTGLGGMMTPVPFAKVDTKTDVGLNIDDATQPTDDLAAKLNALDVNAGKSDAGTNADPNANSDASKSQNTPAFGAATLPMTAGEKNRIKELSMGDDQDDGLARLKTDGNAPAPRSDNAPVESQVRKSAANFHDNLMSLLSAGTDPSGDILTPSALFRTDASATMPWQQTGLSQTSAMSLGTVAQAANITTAPVVAGQPNPATQMIAGIMTRSAQDGSNDTVSIRLDPPELGTVNVRLEFGKDKTVKAHLMVEKPETYMMLQRDGLSLERALQNAGLDANSASISFELASQNGGTFSHDNNGSGGGERNLGGSSRSEGIDDDANTIKSTMNWQVDTATGHVRYNIFA